MCSAGTHATSIELYTAPRHYPTPSYPILTWYSAFQGHGDTDAHAERVAIAVYLIVRRACNQRSAI